MTLEQFGWSDYFAHALQRLAIEDAVVGRIVLEHRQRYTLIPAMEQEGAEIPAEVTGKFRQQAEHAADFPTVGDWVVIQLQDGGTHATIHQVLPRQSQLSRKVSGVKTEEQVLAANIDTVFLMAGLDQDFNLRRLERYLVLAWESGASPVIVLNKADLCEDLMGQRLAVEAIAPGVPIVTLSVLNQEGLGALAPYLQPGKTIALLGSSGVGKSTLTNQLIGQAVQTTQAVRADDSRGRHTTTHRQLLRLPSGALLIDTPGMRELQLWSGEGRSGLTETFADIEALAQACRFRDCRHDQEPGCAVQGAIASGDLDPSRLFSYRKLQREQQYLSRQQRQRLNSKARWKTITKAMRHHPNR